MKNLTEGQIETYKQGLREKLSNVDRFLNFIWAVGPLRLSKDLYELKDAYKGIRKVELDESLPERMIKVENMWNLFTQQTEKDKVIDISDTNLGGNDFTRDEIAVMEKLVQMGVSLFSTMAKKDRDKYPDVIAMYPHILAKLIAKQI